MENMIHLSVVTADGVALDTQVSYVNIPTGSCTAMRRCCAR